MTTYNLTAEQIVEIYDAIADVLIAENVNSNYAQFIADELQLTFGGANSRYYYMVVNDDQPLWRGMEELV